MERARRQMIDQQVRAWDVLDADVLDVLAKVARENFVPDAYRALAFAETEIPIGHGESMMLPTHEGRLLQALDIGPSDRILEIGTGSGYLTCCLAALGAHVTSIDIHESFLAKANERIEQAGFSNIELAQMDAIAELPGATFDAIAVTGSVETFDMRFVDALNPGGRLFVVIGEPPAMDARLVTRSGEKDWESESLFETVLKPLVNGTRPPQFSF